MQHQAERTQRTLSFPLAVEEGHVSGVRTTQSSHHLMPAERHSPEFYHRACSGQNPPLPSSASTRSPYTHPPPRRRSSISLTPGHYGGLPSPQEEGGSMKIQEALPSYHHMHQMEPHPNAHTGGQSQTYVSEYGVHDEQSGGSYRNLQRYPMEAPREVWDRPQPGYEDPHLDPPALGRSMSQQHSPLPREREPVAQGPPFGKIFNRNVPRYGPQVRESTNPPYDGRARSESSLLLPEAREFLPGSRHGGVYGSGSKEEEGGPIRAAPLVRRYSSADSLYGRDRHSYEYGARGRDTPSSISERELPHPTNRSPHHTADGYSSQQHIHHPYRRSSVNVPPEPNFHRPPPSRPHTSPTWGENPAHRSSSDGYSCPASTHDKAVQSNRPGMGDRVTRHQSDDQDVVMRESESYDGREDWPVRRSRSQEERRATLMEDKTLHASMSPPTRPYMHAQNDNPSCRDEHTNRSHYVSMTDAPDVPHVGVDGPKRGGKRGGKKANSKQHGGGQGMGEEVEAYPTEGPRNCVECGRSDTPQWRRGPDGQVNRCNACGLKYQHKRRRMAQQQRMRASDTYSDRINIGPGQPQDDTRMSKNMSREWEPKTSYHPSKRSQSEMLIDRTENDHEISDGRESQIYRKVEYESYSPSSDYTTQSHEKADGATTLGNVDGPPYLNHLGKLLPYSHRPVAASQNFFRPFAAE